MTHLLQDQVVIITGGAGDGIGHGLTEVAAEHGAKVAILDHDVVRAEALTDRLRSVGHTVASFACDVADGDQVIAAVDAVVKGFGRIDGLVNSAGVGLVKPLHECTDDDFNRIVSIDLYGCFAMCRAVLPIMMAQGSGSIVNIASVHAERTTDGFSLYSMVKSGLVGMTRGLAADYGPRGIRANAVNPGLVVGPQTSSVLESVTSDVDGWISHFVRTRQAVPRRIDPRDVGELTAFLLSSRAAGMTGACLPVDAGLLAMISSRSEP